MDRNMKTYERISFLLILFFILNFFYHPIFSSGLKNLIPDFVMAHALAKYIDEAVAFLLVLNNLLFSLYAVYIFTRKIFNRRIEIIYFIYLVTSILYFYIIYLSLLTEAA
jgi:hypothetical protein